MVSYAQPLGVTFNGAMSTAEVKARVEILFRFKSLCEANLAELTALVVKETRDPLHVANERPWLARGLPDGE